MKNVTIFDHPLIQHKTTILRQVSTSNKEFRESVEEITMLMCYEALRDLPLEEIEIETPSKIHVAFPFIKSKLNLSSFSIIFSGCKSFPCHDRIEIVRSSDCARCLAECEPVA